MRRITVFLVIVISLLFFQTSHSHVGPTHQYMTVEAYELLRLNLGQDIPIMVNRVHTTTPATDGGPWQLGYLTRGAYREDLEDPVYRYWRGNHPTFYQDASGLMTLGVPVVFEILSRLVGYDDPFVSVTHFWNADNSDVAITSMHAQNPVSDFWMRVPNSYQKILLYANGGWDLSINLVVYCFPTQSDGSGCSATQRALVTFRYNSLIDLFKNRNIYVTKVTWLNGQETIYNTPIRFLSSHWSSLNGGSYELFFENIAWEALGRMCHLLQDVSVPAHVHIDEHGPYSRGDSFENFMATDRFWTASLVNSVKGPFVDPMPSSNPIHYLMYTSAQIADHFGSNGPYEGDGNDFIGGNPLQEEISFLNSIGLSGLGSPTGMTHPIGNNDLLNIRDHMIPHAIRATAGLLYWFAVESGLINRIVIRNDFECGIVMVNSVSYPSGISFVQPLGVPLNLSTTSPQTHADYIRHFSRWEKKRFNNDLVTTFPTMVWNTSVDGSFTYNARFNKECNITFANNLVGFGNIGPMRIDGVVYNMPHGSFPVIENQNGIEVEALPYPHEVIIDGIQYLFSQWSDGSTERARRLFPNSHQLYTANFVGRPITVSTTLRQTNPTGSFVRLEWNEHQNPNVTRYHIWRHVRQGPHTIDFRQVAVVNRGTTAWVDYDYVVAREGSGYVLEYDVRAYYSIENTYAFDHFWLVGFGNSGTPGNADKLAVREVGKPEAFALGAYPNPFNPSTRIIFDLPEDGVVSLAIFDLLGRKVADMVNESVASGAYSVQWDANSTGDAISGGVYFARFTVTDETGKVKFNKVKKLLLVK